MEQFPIFVMITVSTIVAYAMIINRKYKYKKVYKHGNTYFK